MTPSKFSWLLLAALTCALQQPVQSEAVSTTPPPLYTEQLAKLLTPSSKLISALPPVPAEAEDGWILLDEEVHHVLPDGRRVIVEHQIIRALTDAGAEELGRTIRSYQRQSQNVHVALAQTIQADGRTQAVKTEAMFLQTPQREADYALYDDSGELVIIFPGMKAGATIEWIVVREEKKSRIPGHFTTWLGFEYGWPLHLGRATVELPESLASRLQITPLGRGLPESIKTTMPGGHTRWTWERQNATPRRNEPDRAPFPQTGPLVRLTTLKDWGEFLQWYVPLANRRTDPGPKLKAEVEAMTRDARSAREVFDILAGRVTNDVRYVGLEFGDSDLEPHPVAEVWEHQYGDCKDKASLLRAMLAIKGITSHLALINTDHLGRIEKRSPDFRDFDHVILVAELPEGPVFCDPTLSGAPPGMISPNDAERDVLLVKEPEQWMRTPPQESGGYAVNFDAKVAPTGEISGWATLEATGYMGTRYADAEARGTRQQLKERLSRRIDSCFPGARVVDVKSMPQSSGETYQVQAYFVVPPTGSLTLGFPLDSGTLPDIGDGENRETDVFLWREVVTTTSTFTLPEGFRAASLPPSQSLKSALAEITASWEQTGGALRCKFRYHGKASRLPAADCRAFAQTLASLRAWLGKSVTLEAGGAVTRPTAGDDDLGEFPMMPTGEGQLALVSERFPTSGNLKLRRHALEKTLTWFPKDKALQFNAQVQLAYVDTVENQHDQAIQRLRAPLETLRGSVDADEAALGNYILGLALKNKGEEEASLAVFAKIAGAKDVNAFRRAWSLYQRASLLAKKNPVDAITSAEAGLDLEAGAESDLFQLLAELRIPRQEGEKLSARLTTFLGKEGSDTADVLMGLTALVEEWAGEKPADAATLLGILSKQGDMGRFGQEVSAGFEEAQSAVDSGAALVKAQERLRQWAKGNASSLPSWEIPAKLKTAEEFTKAIETALEVGEERAKADQLIRLGIESLVRFPPGSWYEQRLFAVASYADFLDRVDDSKEPPAVLLELLDLCEMLPHHSDSYQDGRLLRVRMLDRMEKPEEGGKILREMMDDPEVTEGFRVAVLSRYAANCITRRDYGGALGAWRKLADFPLYHSVPGELLKATFTALETGREKEALEFIALLRKAQPSIIEKTEGAQHVRSFLEFAKDDATAKAWWASSAKWWPEWLTFARKHGEVDEGDGIIIPVIPVLRELGEEIGAHGRAGRRAETFAALSKLAHAARWQPLFASEFAGMIQYLSNIGLGNALPGFHQLLITMQDSDSGASQLDNFHVWAVAARIDSGKAESVAAPARRFLDNRKARDGLAAAMARLWGIAATQTGKDLEETARLLEHFLANPPENESRHLSVSSLASIYRKQGRGDDEKALLEKELSHPETLKAGDELDSLRQRLEMLREGGGSGDGPALAAKAWLKVKTPSWFEYARPKDLTDPKAANPDEAMVGNSQLSPPEVVRLCLLISQDASQPDSRRLEAIHRLGWHTSAVTLSDDEANAWITALITEKSLPRRVRALALDSFLRHAFVDEHRDRIVRFGGNVLLEALNGAESDHLKTIRRYGKIAPTDLDGSQQAASELLTGTLDFFAAETVQRMIRRLAFAGRTADAQKLAQGFSTAKFSEAIARDKSSHQLTALKTINLAKKLNPVQDAMRDLYVSHRPLSADKSGPDIPWSPIKKLNLPQAEAVLVRERWVREGTWPRDRLDFWFELTRDLPPDASWEPLSLALLALALEKAPDDLLRAQLISRCISFVDIDDTDTRKRLEDLLKRHRNLPDAPLTRDAFRLHDLRVRLRTGGPGDPFAALNAISDAHMRQQANWSVLEASLGRSDKAALKRIVEGMDPNDLLSPMNAPLAAIACRQLGMADEAQLAEDNARESFYDILLAAWSQPTGRWEPVLALVTAQQIGEASLVPASFSSEVAGILKHELDRLFFLARDAHMRKRWEECARHAAEGRRLYPTFYDFHGYEGTALFHLGRKKEAAELLETFLSHSHNELEAVEARDLLKKARE